MVHPKDKNEILKKDYFKECLNYIRDKILFTPENNNGENIMEKFI
jgi:hypothetical protein